MPGSTSLADYCSGLWGAIGVSIALRHAEASGRGQSIDIGLYELIFRLLDELAPVYQKTGAVRSRMGAEVPMSFPMGTGRPGTGNGSRWLVLRTRYSLA